MSAFSEYEVNLTIRLTTRVVFSRNTEEELKQITKSDAIENAIAAFPLHNYGNGLIVDVIEELKREGFSVALPIEGEAREI